MEMIMFKDFLQMLILLAFLVGIGNVMGAAPGVDAWRDEAGHPAPALVRQAADSLWEAVKIEGGAAFDAGWGVTKETSCGCYRILGAIITLGFNECVKCSSCQEYDEFHRYRYPGHTYGSRESSAIYSQREKEAKEALQRFKNAVNTFVSKPEQYSGDADICQFGSWTEDGRWHIRPDGECGALKFVSASRDLSNVPQSVRAFVNEHGGWTSEIDTRRGTSVHYYIPINDTGQVYSNDPRQPLLSKLEKKQQTND